MLAAVLAVAIVAEDPAVLRNAPRDDAPAQATLWGGDWLEVRGETAGFLKVYDHRHERPGFVRPGVVRQHRLDEATAPELRAVVRFLRDSGGHESLGIGYAALYLRAAPAGTEQSEIFAAIGTMAARLGRRASARRVEVGAGSPAAAARAASATAAQIEVAESYGVHFRAFDLTGAAGAGGGTRVCYDGEAWEQVLASPAAPAIERARAALFLAAGDCLDPAAPAAARRAWNDRRVEALGSVDAAALSPALGGKLRLRRAEALAWRAFDEARRSGPGVAAAATAEGAAIRELALADRGALAPEDVDVADDVAVRVAASRFATETPPRDGAKRQVAIEVVPRAAGESCVRVIERPGAATAKRATATATATATAGAGTTEEHARLLGERCTYGVVWPGALRWAPSGGVATIAVQPLPAWTELWVLRHEDDSTWSIEPLTPAAINPDVGYVESAGFSPDGTRLLVVREAREPGRPQRRFQVLSAPTLTVEKQAGDAAKLLAFKRWSAPSWRAGTLALR